MSETKTLSASKIKTLQSCSWLYWCKYHLKLPEESNSGASRGTICHLIFECLGNPRHKHHYKKIIKHQNVWKSKSIKRLIIYHAKKLNIFNKDDMFMVNDMIVNGLNYDFFGDENSKPSESISEKSFDISVDEDGKKYKIRGFIDKLFLYKKNGKALIRDFKTSKSVFKGKDLTDNLQDLMYSLAVKKIYPKFISRSSEFLFLKFDLEKDLLGKKGEGVINMKEISDDELEGFEYFLTEVQSIIDGFDENQAKSNLAGSQDFPKDGSFSGPLSCGFAKFPNQLKKDGTKMWHCPHKFEYKYFALKDKEGKVIKTAFNENQLEASEDHEIVELKYDGCPHWRK